MSFNAIDRVRRDPHNRPTTVVFFSDMLNSMPELNMSTRGPSRCRTSARWFRYWRAAICSGGTVWRWLKSIVG
jgi:hypothetical protein